MYELDRYVCIYGEAGPLLESWAELFEPCPTHVSEMHVSEMHVSEILTHACTHTLTHPPGEHPVNLPADVRNAHT